MLIQCNTYPWYDYTAGVDAGELTAAEVRLGLRLPWEVSAGGAAATTVDCLHPFAATGKTNDWLLGLTTIAVQYSRMYVCLSGGLSVLHVVMCA